MSEVTPSGWQNAHFDEIFTQISTSGKKVKTSETRSEGRYPVVDQGRSFISGYLDDEHLVVADENPLIIFGDHTREVKWIDFPFIPGADGVKILKPHPALNGRALYYFLCNLSIESKGYARHFKILKDAVYWVPPLAEQSRIVQKLDELLAQVNNLKSRIDAIPELIKRFRQSVIAAAVSGRLTEVWRAENPNTESAEQQVTTNEALKQGKLKVRKGSLSFNRDELYSIPKNWDWVENHRLAEDSTTAICAGPFGTIFKAKDFRTEGIPIIFLRHIGEGYFKTEKPGFMDKTVWEELHQEYSVHGGELLVTKLGDPPGTACLYPKEAGTAMVTPDVIKMSVDKRVALASYLMFFFNSQACKGLIDKLAFGATRLRIDISMFKGFPIPLPPLEEQTEIVRRVEQLFAVADQVGAKVAAAQTRIDILARSILAKAFRGELTADWRTANPELISGDNSVDALFKKIKSMRENEVKKPNVRRVNSTKKGQNMNKEIINVTEALMAANTHLSGQQLMAASGYQSDSSTEQLEAFFLDIREALEQKKIVIVSRDENNQDWFAISDKK